MAPRCGRTGRGVRTRQAPRLPSSWLAFVLRASSVTKKQANKSQNELHPRHPKQTTLRAGSPTLSLDIKLITAAQSAVPRQKIERARKISAKKSTHIKLINT